VLHPDATRRTPATVVVVLAVLLSLAMALGACSVPDPEPVRPEVAVRRIVPAEEAATDATFVIGVVLAATGVLAADEQPVLEALRAAVVQRNAQGGIRSQPVELRVADSESSPVTAARVTAELAGGGVDLFVMGCDVDVASTVARTARRSGRIAVSPCAGDDSFGTDTASMSGFTFAPSLGSQVDAVVARAISTGATSAVTVTALRPYEHAAACRRFVEAYRAKGGTVVAELELPPGDLRSGVAERLARVAPTPLVVSCLGRGDTGPVLRALRDAGVGASTVALVGADAPPWPEDTVDGVVYPTVADLSRPSGALAPMVAAGATSGGAVMTFVTLDVLARAAEQADDLRGASIAAVLRREAFPTPVGTLRIDARQRATGHTLVLLRTAAGGPVPA
jgi:ABC-type branched-subunit amino acid transport system substrate-binding protein